jgi:3-(methylthio)propanoyl-CoA dehydrogenase
MKIYSIWEGTNFIQSMDLVGRKMNMKGGSVFTSWVQEMVDFYEKNKGNESLSKEFANLGKALNAYQDMHKALAQYSKSNVSLIPLYSHRVLTATAQLYSGRQILDQALLADKKAKELGPEHFDYKFYSGKVATARYYVRNVVPNVWAVAEIVIDGDTSAIDVPVEVFEY